MVPLCIQCKIDVEALHSSLVFKTRLVISAFVIQHSGLLLNIDLSVECVSRCVQIFLECFRF